MKLSNFPFTLIDWSTIEPTEHTGDAGKALWRTIQLGDLRVRQVDYTPGYIADHWCTKGHVVLCVAGSLETELGDGRHVSLKPGMSYQIADDAEPHRSRTEEGATLFIVD